MGDPASADDSYPQFSVDLGRCHEVFAARNSRPYCLYRCEGLDASSILSGVALRGYPTTPRHRDKSFCPSIEPSCIAFDSKFGGESDQGGISAAGKVVPRDEGI